MTGKTVIVMYHYVRDPMTSRYPGLKARTFEEFKRQLDYLEKHYTIVSSKQITDALSGTAPLPEKSCFLTFDDGYIDHYLFVFPELFKRGLHGAFYPSVQGARREKLMEVNKIQLILARRGYNNPPQFLREFRITYEKRAAENPALPSFEALLANHYTQNSNSYNPPEIAFFKVLFQYVLPSVERTSMLDQLFASALDVDEKTIASEMYMSVDMMRVMAKSGMHFGSHGATHVWMDKISREEQQREIDESLGLLGEIYTAESFPWSMCYPFGGFNDTLRSILAESSCLFAVTTFPEMAVVIPENRFLLSRLDTNDFPH